MGSELSLEEFKEEFRELAKEGLLSRRQLRFLRKQGILRGNEEGDHADLGKSPVGAAEPRRYHLIKERRRWGR